MTDEVLAIFGEDARAKMRLHEATLEVYESVIDEFQSSLTEEDGTMEGGS